MLKQIGIGVGIGVIVLLIYKLAKQKQTTQVTAFKPIYRDTKNDPRSIRYDPLTEFVTIIPTNQVDNYYIFSNPNGTGIVSEYTKTTKADSTQPFQEPSYKVKAVNDLYYEVFNLGGNKYFTKKEDVLALPVLYIPKKAYKIQDESTVIY